MDILGSLVACAGNPRRTCLTSALPWAAMASPWRYGPRMSVTSTLLDQAHNALERQLFAMKRFHHPHGSPQACLTGLAHLSTLIPYQRRPQPAGQCGVEGEGGSVPAADWFLSLQILPSGGFR